MQHTLLKQLRLIGILEGISYLVLLFIAMPLKYFADMPLPVKYTGWAHGLLFVLFCLWVLFVALKYKQSFWWMVQGGLASLLPFGTFVWDKQLKKLQEEPAKN